MHQLAGSGRVEAERVLRRFREQVFDCFGRRADALFEVVDALAGADRPLRSVAELMWEPAVRRGWGSLYQALNHGTMDTAMLRDVLAGLVGCGRAGWPLLLAVDATIYPRPDTRVVADVGMQYAERGPDSTGRARPGWSLQWMCRVGEVSGAGARTSWAAPLDVRRVASHEMASEVAAVQVGQVWDRLSEPVRRQGVLFLYDAGYDVISLTQQLPAGAQLLGRLRSNRVFYGRPTPRRPGQRGRSPIHGARFTAPGSRFATQTAGDRRMSSTATPNPTAPKSAPGPGTACIRRTPAAHAPAGAESWRAP